MLDFMVICVGLMAFASHVALLSSTSIDQRATSSSLLSSCGFSQSPDAEAPSTAEVDLFMSTQRIKVLNADTQVYNQLHNGIQSFFRRDNRVVQ